MPPDAAALTCVGGCAQNTQSTTDYADADRIPRNPWWIGMFGHSPNLGASSADHSRLPVAARAQPAARPHCRSLSPSPRGRALPRLPRRGPGTGRPARRAPSAGPRPAGCRSPRRRAATDARDTAARSRWRRSAPRASAPCSTRGASPRRRSLFADLGRPCDAQELLRFLVAGRRQAFPLPCR